jgi:hypothetical protein
MALRRVRAIWVHRGTQSSTYSYAQAKRWETEQLLLREMLERILVPNE